MVQRGNTELIKVWLEKGVSWVNISTVSRRTSGILAPKLGPERGLTTNYKMQTEMEKGDINYRSNLKFYTKIPTTQVAKTAPGTSEGPGASHHRPRLYSWFCHICTNGLGSCSVTHS